MKKKYTRQSYYDAKEKRYNIYYIDAKGKINIVDYALSKQGTEYILASENKGKPQITHKPPSQKKSKVITARIDRDMHEQQTVDRLLKKKKLSERDKDILAFYSDKNYRKNDIIKKYKQVGIKLPKTKKEKAKKGNYITLKNFWVTYCHTSTAFFYFGAGGGQHKKINNILKKFLEQTNYSRVRLSLTIEDDIIFDDFFPPKNVGELQEHLTSLLAVSGLVDWTNEQCNIKIEGLL